MKILIISLRIITTALVLWTLFIAEEHAKAYNLQQTLGVMITGWLLGKIMLSFGPYYKSFNLDCIAMGLLIGWVSIITHPEYKIKNNELEIENTKNSELNEEYLKYNVPQAIWNDKYVRHDSYKLEKIELLTKRASDLRAIDNYTFQLILALLSVMMIFKGCYTIFKPS